MSQQQTLAKVTETSTNKLDYFCFGTLSNDDIQPLKDAPRTLADEKSTSPQ